MNPEIKSRWTAELRSGRFEQGKGALRIAGDAGDQYCCLGVLCQLAVEAGVIPAARRHAFDGLYEYDGRDGLPSQKVAEWAGFPVDHDGHPYENPGFWLGESDDIYQTSLADQNDNGASFSEIADLIDKHL